jgi:hypothetical protein
LTGSAARDRVVRKIMTATYTAPLPAGAQCTDNWEPDIPHAYRIIHGENRGVEGQESLTVWTTATQFADGNLDVRREPPSVNVDGLCWEEGLDSVQARELAQVLIECAHEIDRWAGN